MVIIKFKVKGQLLILETDLKKLVVSSDTINQFKCQFEFDDNWEGFEKRIYFKNASFNITKPRIPDELGYCYIPSEVLAHTGVILCNVVGVKYSNTSVAERLTTRPVRFFCRNTDSRQPLDVFVQREESILEPDEADITPTEYEQFVANVRTYAQSAISAKDEAEAAESKIENMTVSAIPGEEGTDPVVTKTEYDDHFNLEFQIPRGAKGEQGEDGAPGDKGDEPVITATKVGKVTTVYVDGVAIATINDGKDGSGGGADVFIAEVGTTTYAEVDTAYNEGKILVAKYGVHRCPLVGVFSNANPKYYRFQTINGDSVDRYDITINDDWSINQFIVASNAVATTTTKGLMSASDKTKLNGIAAGAEVNVQSDWNQTNTTADDYINNKPTIPDELSDLRSDSTHRTVTDTEKTMWNGKSDFSGSYNDLTNKPTIPTDKVFIAEKDVTTYAEVTAALEAGKAVFAKTSNSFGTINIYEYAFDNGASYYFYRHHGSSQVNILTVDNTDTWSTGFSSFVTANRPIIVDTVSVSSRSFPANQAYWFAANDVAIPQKSGYTPVGAFSCTASSGGLIVCPLVLASNTSVLYGFARNITSSAITQSIEIPIMYVRNELL